MYPFLFYNHLGGEERAGCFKYVVFRMSCRYYRSLTLPRGAMGWSVVCECGISLSYSLTFGKEVGNDN